MVMSMDDPAPLLRSGRNFTPLLPLPLLLLLLLLLLLFPLPLLLLWGVVAALLLPLGLLLTLAVVVQGVELPPALAVPLFTLNRSIVKYISSRT